MKDILLDIDGISVVLVRLKGPDKGRWAKGTGARYEVWRGFKKIGEVASARLSTPPPPGSRIRPGTSYTAWGATLTGQRTWWRDTRIAAVRAMVKL